MKTLSLTAAAAFLFTAAGFTPASAQNELDDYWHAGAGYAGFSAGWASVDSDQDSTDIDDSFNISGRIGRYAGPFRVEAQLSYSPFDEGVEIGTVDIDGDYQTIALFGNVLYEAEVADGWSIYGGGGVGGAYADLEIDVEETVSGERFSVDDTDVTFVWQLMAGVAVDISDGVRLDVGYRYVEFDAFEFDDIAAEFADGSVHLIEAGLRFAF